MSTTAAKPERGLTFRAVVVGFVSLLLMGMWIEFEENFNRYGGPLAENSPPNSAVGVIGIVMAISAGLYLIRRSLRLRAPELVVIYAALVMAAPLMTQGLWHRLFGLMAAVPHSADFKTYDSLPSMLWPHGDNLIENHRFTHGLDGFQHAGGVVDWVEIDRGEKGVWRSPRLANAGDPAARAALSVVLPRLDARGRELLVAGEAYLFSMLIHAEGFDKGSSCLVTMQTGVGPPTPVLVHVGDTKPTFANPGGFVRVGANPVIIPRELGDSLTLTIGLSGDGRMALQDLEFFNNEAVASAYSGRSVVDERGLEALPPNERNATVVKPEAMVSLAGARYLLTGFIPVGQWVRPLVAWSILIAAMFMGFLGLNVVMRKQWAEHERFTFPLTILPRQLFEECVDAEGRVYHPVFRNRLMWIGFAATLVLALLRGLAFYFPELPSPIPGEVRFADYVTSPVLKAYLKNVGLGTGGFGFTIAFCLLAIALLIETEVLFSLWLTFLVFQLWFLCGRAFNFSRVPGYPWESQQNMGAFIAYALLAVFVGRHHLWKVLRLALGRGSAAERTEERGEMFSYRTALLMVIGALALIAAWSVWTEMGLVAGLLFFGYMLVCGFAASKIRAECGAPWSYMTPYYGMQFVAAMGGFAVFRSTGMLVATIAAGFMCTASFLLMAPVQAEMTELGRQFRVRSKHVGAGLTLGLLGGLVIGGFVFMCWTYGFGANNRETVWPYTQNFYFNQFRAGATAIDRAFESGAVGVSPEDQPLNIASNVHAKGLTIGAAITLVLSFLRARFMWFPFHPLGYVLASTFMMKSLWFTAFLAWLIRSLVLRLGGARTIRHGLVPFCVGMFLAAVTSILIFDGVGIILRLQGVTTVFSQMP